MGGSTEFTSLLQAVLAELDPSVIGQRRWWGSVERRHEQTFGSGDDSTLVKSGRRAEPTKGKHMRVRTKVGLVVAMVAALLAIAPAANAQEVLPTEAEAVSRSVVSFRSDAELPPREQFGFPSIASERVSAEARENNSLLDYGAALLDSEAAELKIRFSMLDESDRVQELAEKNPGFGGMYLDHQSGELVINLATDEEKERERFEDTLRQSGLFHKGTENRVVVREVNHSLEQLSAAQDVIDKQVGKGLIRATGVLRAENRLWVALDESLRSERLADTVEPFLNGVPREIPISVSFGLTNGEDACNDRRDCAGGGTTRRAGVGVRVGTGVCTTGFAFKRANGDEFISTAGHCWFGTSSGTAIRAWDSSQYFGSLGSINPYANASTVICDCRLIQTADNKTANVLYRSDNVKWRTITAKTLHNQETDLVRMFGAGTNIQSIGSVEMIGITIDGTNDFACGCVVFDMTLASYDAVGGDSGAAITRSTISRAAGIHSGETMIDGVTYGRFADVDNMQDALGGVVMTTAN